MRSSRPHRRNPLAVANAALDQLVLRHFGLQLSRTETKEPPPRTPRRGEGPPAP